MTGRALPSIVKTIDLLGSSETNDDVDEAEDVKDGSCGGVKVAGRLAIIDTVSSGSRCDSVGSGFDGLGCCPSGSSSASGGSQRCGILCRLC